jgi:hypothetical protein
MALILADRVRDTTTTTGTGSVTLSGTAPTGYQTFEAGIGNTNTTYYTINAGSQWEVGIGTYSSTGPTLSRDTVLSSSNGNALVNFAVGTKDVFVTYPSGRAVTTDGVQTLTNKTLNSPTLVTPTLGAASATSIANALGAVGTPSYTFTGDTNTGMWSPAADTLALSTNGAERLRVDASGNVGVGTTSPNNRLQSAFPSPSIPASVPSAGAGAHGLAVGGAGFGIAAGALSSGNSYLQVTRWDGTAANYDLLLQPNGGNVGVGVTSPAQRLSVAGAGSFSGTGFGTATSPSVLLSNTTPSTGRSYGLNSTDGGLFQIYDVTAGNATRVVLDSSGNLGVGTTAPDIFGRFYTRSVGIDSSGTTALQINGTTYGTIDLGFNGTRTANILAETAGFYLQTVTASPMVFVTNGSERMRIDASGNVAIGTSGQVDKLFVYANSTGSGVAVRQDGAGPIQTWLGLGAAERMRITAAGNLGVGTSSPSTILHINAGPAVDTNVRLQAGAAGNHAKHTYSNASNTVMWTSGYQSSSGNFGINVGDSFNATGITLDSSGNVGIGTTAPNAKLNVNSAAGATLSIGFNNTSVNYYDANTQIFRTGSFAETMRIDASGNLLVGTTTTTYSTAGRGLIEVNGSSSALIAIKTGDTARGYFAASSSATELSAVGASQPLLFTTNSAERARIDSSGNVLVGKTADVLANVGHLLSANGSFTATRDGNPVGFLNRLTSDGEILTFWRSTVQVGNISVTTTATAYNTSSDYRLKDIDGPVANSGAYIDALKPVQGSWKADGSRFIGLLAHEVQEVSETQIATGEKDGDEMQAMDYSAPEIIANLIAEIQNLRARVAQLEGN